MPNILRPCLKAVLFLISLSVLSCGSAKDGYITVSGIAENSGFGACVATEKVKYYIMDKSEWEETIIGKKIVVSGGLRTVHYLSGEGYGVPVHYLTKAIIKIKG